MKFSVVTEKHKSMVGRQFGENKKVIKDAKLLQSLAQNAKLNQQKAAAAAGEKKENETEEEKEQRVQAMVALEKYQRLVQRI